MNRRKSCRKHFGDWNAPARRTAACPATSDSFRPSLLDTEAMIVSLAQSSRANGKRHLYRGQRPGYRNAKTIEDALADMFEAIGRAFIDMAAQIIAKQLTMIALQSILKALGGATGGTSSGPNVDAIEQYTGIGNNTPMDPYAVGFAQGGFVTSPTKAMVGEGGENEYVIPADKMSSALQRYNSGARGNAVIEGTNSLGGSTAL